MDDKRTDNQVNIINRLKKIEGQVKGIQRMVDSGKCCDDIMIQISAVRSAINKVGGIILDTYIKDCLIASLKNEENDDKLNDLINTLVKYVK
ncbi:MAG: metal-sensitive transcriptional regulator [Clostridiales bacterium]|jgi:DNA-binding FrmR family transcriptional regulator|nr:metal-sensitive transcriptional regulator [Clostridiales bacterium]